jgi:antitoxin component YwqK of YwqJK toxin-antitoxin module
VLWRLSKRVPEEILEYVLLRVDHKSLMTLCTTDERFAKICDDETFLRKHEKLRTVVTNSKTYANNIETDVERIQYDEKQHIVTRRNGKIVGEEYLIDGKLERLNGPAYISYRQDGTILFEKYYVDGKLYRLSGPVVVVYDKNGKIDKEQYCDKLSQNSSIVITYYYEGTIRSIAYYENDILHRLNGPAFINYDTNGKIYSREYFENGKKHRLNGPAFIFYDENGSIYSEEYYEDDNLHRLNGPAVILYDKNGHIFREEHWERGKRK